MLELIEAAAKTPFASAHGAGVDATFVKLNDTWAIKHYPSKQDAELTYARQKYAAMFELAPQVGLAFTFYNSDGEQRWGYVTEIAKLREQFDYDEKFWDDWYEDVYYPLFENLEYIDLRPGDLHPSNMGFLSNNRPVAIDLGFGGMYCLEHVNDSDVCNACLENGFDLNDFIPTFQIVG